MKSYEKYISKSAIEKIHDKTLYILENIGIEIDHEEARQLFKKNGAVVDGNIVKIPNKMVEDALKLAKPEFEIYSTKLDQPIKVGGGSALVGPASSNIYINEDGKIRKMTDEDVINQFKLSDTSKVISLSNMNFTVDETGMSDDQKKFGNLATQLKYSNKSTALARPNMFHTDEENIFEEYTKGIKILKKFEGVEEVNKIVHIGIMSTLTPLALHGGQIAMALAICKENQAVWLTPCALPLMTSPGSMAGMLAVTNAEVLAGYVLCKLANPEVAFIYGNTSGSTDMRTLQLTIGTPETALVCYATAGLADLYNLPFRTGGGLSDAKDFDIQAGLESDMMIRASLDCGADFIHHGCGSLGTFNIVSFEKFLIDEEIYMMNARLLRGIDTEEKDFQISEIEQVGPRGSFLKGRTPKSYRKDFYLSSFLNKEDPNQWQSGGAISVRRAVSDGVQKRLDSYIQPSISKEQDKLLEAYLPEKYKNNI
ncbi:trimethylamine methyltransferase family protein [Alkalibacter mobilis]|uniref:trimethylamine methyltransferase family protein n=1 Tax=Alkalibacter mobilis TaxID=2787712 RepID=UPI00189E504A|nr:trimethylamine methyltransferase family protein [Alkalibacter mobilis]MBF7097884.1 trimethylamine methyltransferase family protein [Alkalibacter mobilis]